jgi:hypothetical protein
MSEVVHMNADASIKNHIDDASPSGYVRDDAVTELARGYSRSKRWFPLNRHASSVTVPKGPEEVRTQRYCYRFTHEGGQFPFVAEYAAPAVANAMTVRSMLIASLVTTDSLHVNAPCGLDAAIGRMKKRLDKEKLPHDGIRLVVNPTTARRMPGPRIMSDVTYQTNPNLKYGQPATIRGVDLVVENAVALMRDDMQRRYVWPTATALLCYQSEEFSTFVFRFRDECVVETKGNQGRVVEDHCAVFSAPEFAYRIDGGL